MTEKELKELNELFKEAKDLTEEELGGYITLPDGHYNGVVEDLEITTSKNDNLMFVMTFKITDTGEYKDFEHKKFIMLAGNDERQRLRNLNTFATECKKLGIDTSTYQNAINDLGTGLDKKVELTIETTVSKAGKSYTNTSFKVI